MKQFMIYCLAIVTSVSLFSSCGGKSVDANPDVAKMSDAGKKAMDKASQSLCTCLKDHGDGLSDAAKELKGIIAEAEKAGEEEKMAMMGKVMGAMAKMKDFGECMDKAKPSGEDEDAMEADIEKIIGEDADSKTKNKKTFEMLQAFLDKNCSADAKKFKDFMSIMEEMDKMRN